MVSIHRFGCLFRPLLPTILISAFALLAGCGGGTSSDIQPAEVSSGLGRALSAVDTPAISPALQVVALTKVSEKRVTRTLFEYVYRVTVRNGGAAVNAVVAEVSSVGAGTILVDGRAEIGHLDVGEERTSSDTITLRHDRLLPFNLGALTWVFASGLDVSQIAPGYELLRGLDGDPAFVGELFESRVVIRPNDPRNSIVRITVANAMISGAPVEVDLSGGLRWTPNEADFAGTSRLLLTVELATGPASSIELPLSVLKRRLVLQVPIPQAGGTVADGLGRYLIELKSSSQQLLQPGTFVIEEHFAADGAFVYVLRSGADENLSLKVLRAPELLPSPINYSIPAEQEAQIAQSGRVAMLSLARKSSSTSNESERAAAGLLPDVGARLGALSGDFGQKAVGNGILLTTRSEPFTFFRQSAEGLTERESSVPFNGIYQIDANCFNIHSCRGIGTGSAQQISRTPVILLHGFPVWGTLGGGSGTWGTFAKALGDRGHPHSITHKSQGPLATSLSAALSA